MQHLISGMKNQDNQVVNPQREIKDRIVVSALGLTALNLFGV